MFWLKLWADNKNLIIDSIIQVLKSWFFLNSAVSGISSSNIFPFFQYVRGAYGLKPRFVCLFDIRTTVSTCLGHLSFSKTIEDSLHDIRLRIIELVYLPDDFINIISDINPLNPGFAVFNVQNTGPCNIMLL